VTTQPPEPAAPHIRIEVDRGEVTIRQQRPAVLSSLVGKPVAAALPLVSALLPVCGQAQSVAAGRAVAAARRTAAAEGAGQARRLLREQAFAAAWRNCVDWPDLLGEERTMADLGAVHRAGQDATRAAALARLAPGLAEVRTLDQLLAWVAAGGCVGARVAQLALGTGRPLAAVRCLAGAPLCAIAAQALGREPFDPLQPWDGPVDVGSLAMARDPLVAVVQEQLGTTILARLLAQLLDTRFICGALADTGAEMEAPADSWRIAERTGIGRAITARGPVFHRITLAADGACSVADWRVLAPTDWHFSAAGPVAGGLRGMEDAQAMRLLVASYDPCAPWSLDQRGAVPRRHA
jgi:hypothetical protein